MSTPYLVPIEAFLKRIEEDRNFFNYLNLTDDEAMEIAYSRAKNFLFEAIGELTLKCTPIIDFYDTDDVLEEFTSDWTGQEVYLISSLMYQQYLDRDIAKLKCLSVNYTSTDLRVFDPSNARTTYKALYDTVCSKNLQSIDDYASRDRLTGKLIGINFSSYDESE